MIIAHGIDLVHCPRVERIWKQHGDHFLERIYTVKEREYCLATANPVTRLAGRFAVKEAVMKALGSGWRGGVEWIDIETLPDPLGRPLLTVRGKSAELASVLGIHRWLVSISHANDYATASAIGLAKP